MATPAPPHLDNIDIPDRPSVSSAFPRAGSRLTRRVLLWGGLSALALVTVAVIALVLGGGDDREVRSAAEAPLIRAEEQPIKVSPESPGGMEVPNRDIMIYGRLQHEKLAGKPPVERLLPEPERPLLPPPPAPSSPAQESQHTARPDALTERDSGLTMPAPEGDTIAPATPSPTPVPPSAVGAPSLPSSPPKLRSVVPGTADKASKPAAGSFQLQLFSARSPEDAKAAWTKLKARNGDLLGALSPVVARANLGERGTFYRLRAGPVESEARAQAICDALSDRGASCIIIRRRG
jgi:SPOR domain